MDNPPVDTIFQHGFVRVAAACPKISLADPASNAQRILHLAGKAQTQGADVVLFGELCLTGYTCGDLFLQPQFQKAALVAFSEVVKASTKWPSMALVVGLPWANGDKLFNVAAVISGGMVKG
ncbi:MAG: nitrilase-related carbon-nitrogen hydrolase, partial [Gemmataceae bacterium]